MNRRWILGAALIGLVLAGVGAFLLCRELGPVSDGPGQSVGSSTGSSHTLFHVLLALAAVIALGRLLARAFAWIGQPPVIGEVVAGLLLGPSLLGRISPDAMRFLVPLDVAPHLGTIAQLGAVLYMFVVGLELNTGRLRELADSVLAVSVAGLVVPFTCGAALAVWLYPVVSSATVPFTSFALFVGVAFAITAFPVLARILSDRGLEHSKLGITALGAAAIGDVIAWCLLALVVGVARQQVDEAILVVVWSGLFVIGMLVLVRPLVATYVRRHEATGPTSAEIAIVLVGVLVAALITEGIGVHAVFGAFLFGALIPHDSRLARDVERKLADVVMVFLLPAFFAITGLRTEIGLVSGATDWAICAAIILVATIAKFVGAGLAARLTGHGWRDSAAIGALMNTRGLMELIVLNIGLDLGVISPRLFAMMVLMALVTTMATSPALRLLLRSRAGSIT